MARCSLLQTPQTLNIPEQLANFPVNFFTSPSHPQDLEIVISVT